MVDKAKYLIGIDSGGTYTKAVVFDVAGNQVAAAYISIPFIEGKYGLTERSMEQIYLSTCKCVKKAIRTSYVDPSCVLAIGLSGHGKGLYATMKEGITPINGILSTDNRASKIVNRWKNEGVIKNAKQISCQNTLACHPVALLKWYKENLPSQYKLIDTVYSLKDYLRYKMTGSRAQELTDASGSNVVNLKTKQYDSQLFKLFEIEEVEKCFPPLINSTDIAGTLNKSTANKMGLFESTIVSGGLFDIDACALGAGMIDEQRLTMISGTWSINEYLSKVPADSDKIAMNSIFCLNDYYLVEECSQTGAGNLEWFIRNIIKQRDYNKINKMVAQTDETNDLYFLPYLYGGNLKNDPMGSFIGLHSKTLIKDMIRAIYEGVAFTHKIHYNKLLKTRDKPLAIRLAGGVAKSVEWTKIFSNVMDIDIEIVENTELGALGAMLTAGVAAGQYTCLKKAVEKTVKVSKKISPNPTSVKVYEKKFDKFYKLAKELDNMW